MNHKMASFVPKPRVKNKPACLGLAAGCFLWSLLIAFSVVILSRMIDSACTSIPL